MHDEWLSCRLDWLRILILLHPTTNALWPVLPLRASACISNMAPGQWRQSSEAVVDWLFQFRFVQQFAVLFYKNGEWWAVRKVGTTQQHQLAALVCWPRDSVTYCL